LIKVNGLLLRPTLSWRKIGDPVSNKPMTVKTTKIGAPKNSPRRANTKSNKRIN
jgi:hypothetical protein